MELKRYFADFIGEIRLQQCHIDDLKMGHGTLQKRLKADENLSDIIITTFLQGSYRRATAVKPCNGKRADADVVVVTKLSEQEYPNPDDAMNVFVPFLKKYYLQKWQKQGRSFGIELSYVDLDLVITSAPSEAEIGILTSKSVASEESLEDIGWGQLRSFGGMTGAGEYALIEKAAKIDSWKTSPLRIPNRDAKCWERTHPLAQIQWTQAKNRSCNEFYLDVVKSVKWWHRQNPNLPKYPKGYPVEHIIGCYCPDGITSIAEGITRSLEGIANDPKLQAYASLMMTPFFPDHGVPEHNVFGRVSGQDFSQFFREVGEAAKLARQAIDEPNLQASAELWQKLLGNEFPTPEDSGSGSKAVSGGYTARESSSALGRGRFG